MVLTQDWFLLTSDAHKTDATLKNKPLMDQTFTAQRQWFEYTFDTNDPAVPPKPKVDDDPEKFIAYNEAVYEFDINKRKRDATREFWGKHRQIKHKTDLRNGFKPDLPPVAYIEITSQTELNNHLKDVKWVEIFNRVKEYSDQELLDLCLYYSPANFGKTKGQILHGLLSLSHIGTDDHWKAGALFQKGVCDDFLNNYDPNNSTVSMKIYISKAIAMGIIVRTTGGYALQNGTFVGKDVNDAVLYFSSDMASYTNIIQPEVNKNSALPDDDMADYVKPWKARTIHSADKAVVQTAKNSAYNADFQRVKAEYESLGGKKGMGYNDMKEWIANKHIENAEVEKAESLPTAALELEVEPWNTEDLNKLKKLGQKYNIAGYAMYQDNPESKAKLRAKIKEKATVVA